MVDAAYLIISAAFVAAWMAASCTVVSVRWHRTQPGLSAFLVLGTIQAASCVFAGAHPSIWWVTHVWAPVELLVMEAALYAAVEAVWSRWWLLWGALVGGVAFPRGAFGLGALMYYSLDMAVPDWYWMFLRAREWLWISIVATVAIHSLWLLYKPVRLMPGAYRSRWIFALYAMTMAIGGASWPATGTIWMHQQAIFRGVVIVLLTRWCLLAPLMAKCLAGGVAADRPAAYRPRPM